MTKYFYDTEFLDDGSTIELISIGIVCDDGREYYAVNADMDRERITSDKWLKENVWPHLPIQWNDNHPTIWLDNKSALVKPKWVIANEVRDFLLHYVMFNESGGEDRNLPELWAYYAAYDHVALAQLWGPMMHLPKGIPMWTHDLMQLQGTSKTPWLPKQASTKHNALEDARWNMLAYQALTENTP